MARYDTAEVRRAAAQNWWAVLRGVTSNKNLLEALDIAEKHVRGRTHTFCPQHGGKHGDAYRLYPTGDGGGVCNTCGAQSDGFATLMFSENWNFPQALEEVAKYLGIAPISGQVQQRPAARELPPRQVQSKATLDPNEQKRIMRSLAQTWAESLSIDDPKSEIARIYFSNRALDPARVSPFIRFHPNLYYKDRASGQVSYHPGLVTKYYGGDGSPVTIHRTYLNQFGQKAKLSDVRKSMQVLGETMAGAALRLDKPSPVLFVAEGIETALSPRQVYQMPTWANGNTSQMRNMAIPAMTKVLIVWADRDPANGGESAARALIDRAKQQGVVVKAFMPPASMLQRGEDKLDWNDVLKRYGPDGFPDLSKLVRTYRAMVDGRRKGKA